MKIALLSDIHGNIFALKKVLSEVTNNGIKKLLVLGDLVGYYDHADKVLDAISKFDCQIIQGNHERMLFDTMEDATLDDNICRKYGGAIKRARSKLKPDQLEMLKLLPQSLKLEIDGVKFSLNHGAPWDQDFYVYPDADDETLRKFLNYEAKVFLMGHTHYSMNLSFHGKTLFNPGSVGQSRKKGEGGLASWGIYDSDKKSFHVIKTPYETASLIEESKKNDPHMPYLWNVLNR